MVKRFELRVVSYKSCGKSLNMSYFQKNANKSHSEGWAYSIMVQMPVCHLGELVSDT